MPTLTVANLDYECLWASDVSFDGIRLEVYESPAELRFEVSVPEQGSITINTFSRNVPADLIAAATEMVRERS